MKAIAALFLFVAIAGAMVAQGIDFERKGLEKAKRKADKEGKFIFVDAYTTWCGPCKWMSANVFTDKEVGDFFNENFINVKMDIEKGEGIDFADQYRVVTYPTLLVIDSEGDLVHKRLGAAPVEELLAFGKAALDPEKRIGTLITEYEKGNRDQSFLKVYISRMIESGMVSQEEADEYFASLDDEELTSEHTFELITRLRPPMNSEKFRLIATNREAFYTAVGAHEVDKFLKFTANDAMINAIYKGDEEEIAALKAQIQEFEGEWTGEVLLFANMREAWGDGNYPAFIEYADEYATQYVWDDWNTLNTIAWDIYEDSDHRGADYLGLGLKLAKRSVEIDENYYNADTYAALLYKSGQFKKALEWAETAIEYAEEQEMEFKETKYLLVKIKAELL